MKGFVFSMGGWVEPVREATPGRAIAGALTLASGAQRSQPETSQDGSA